MRPVLFVDIETVPDVSFARKVLGSKEELSDREVLARVSPPRNEGEEYAFLKPPYHRVVAVACLFFSGEMLHSVLPSGFDDLHSFSSYSVRYPRQTNRGSLSGFAAVGSALSPDQEPEILERWWSLFDFLAESTNGYLRLVSFNGRGFDLPVLTQRALYHRISPRSYLANAEMTNRYRVSHLDIMDWLSHYRASPQLSQHELATLLHLPGKLGVDGSDVSELVATGDELTLRGYCLADVFTLAASFSEIAQHAGFSTPGYSRLLNRVLSDLSAKAATELPLLGVWRSCLPSEEQVVASSV